MENETKDDRGQLDLTRQIEDLKKLIEVKDLRIKHLETQVDELIDCWNEHHKM